MKLLFLCNLFPPHFLGGYEVLARNVARMMSARGHEVEILTSNYQTDSRSGREDGLLVHRLLHLESDWSRRNHHTRRERLRANRRNQALTQQLLEQRQPDLVFIWSQLRITLGPAQAIEQRRLPCVYLLNDGHIAGFELAPLTLAPRRLVGGLLDRTLFRQLSRSSLRMRNVVCLSQALKDELLDKGLPVQDSSVVHHGIPIEDFPCKGSPGAIHQPMRLLFAGQLHAYKGAHTLLVAMRKLMDSIEPGAVQVTFVGDGDEAYKRQLRELAEGPARIEFRGRVQPESMPSVYRQHDVLVFPSIWAEPLGLTHMEAMASGTTVVSTLRGGSKEFLEDGVNCLTFRAGDADALARRLLQLIQNPDLAARLAREGRRVAESVYSLQRYVADLEKITRIAV